MDQAIMRSIVYYEFLQGHPARYAAANICTAFKMGVARYSKVYRWFNRFVIGEISFEDRQCRSKGAKEFRDRHTDRQTDRRTDRQTKRFIVSRM
uniref:HTH_48 domain-containing protein n=1 Tax=Haemonchus contortus TaxID=6289 RepID=A0A7I5E9I2_HAECO